MMRMREEMRKVKNMRVKQNFRIYEESDFDNMQLSYTKRSMFRIKEQRYRL